MGKLKKAYAKQTGLNVTALRYFILPLSIMIQKIVLAFCLVVVDSNSGQYN